MNIRDFTTEDKEAVIAMLYRFQTYFEELDPEKRVKCRQGYGEAYTADLLEKVEKYQGKIVVAEDEKTIGFAAGFIEDIPEQERLAHIPATIGYVTDLYVEPEYRGTGIGKQFMEEMEKHFKAKDCTMMTLRVFKPNELAHEFYKNLGYEDRDYIMEKML